MQTSILNQINFPEFASIFAAFVVFLSSFFLFVSLFVFFFVMKLKFNQRTYACFIPFMVILKIYVCNNFDVSVPRLPKMADDQPHSLGILTQRFVMKMLLSKVGFLLIC